MACRKNRDAELQKAIDDLHAFDLDVEYAVRAHPDGDGLATAESILASKKSSLHDALASFDLATIGPEAAMALTNACVQNRGSAQNARDYVKNAVLKTNPDLVARASKLAVDMCLVCPTDTSRSVLAGP